jgi:sortase A
MAEVHGTRSTESLGGDPDVRIEWDAVSDADDPWATETGRDTGDDARARSRRIASLRWAARIAIILGVVVIAFAGFYWWQDEFVTAQHQDRLESEFEARTALVSAGMPLSVFAGERTEDDGSDTAPETIDTGEEGDDPRMALPAESARPDGGAEEQIPGIIREYPPATGEVLGRIRIPSIGVDWMVVEGVSLAELRKGPGHMSYTVIPGQPGNSVISGHRTTNGAPFFDLDLLEPGDLIHVETLTGIHTYAVVDSTTVTPDGVWVTEQRNGAWLTLTTCNPKYSARERLIVFAQLIDGPNFEAIEAALGGDYEPPTPPD